MSSYLPILKDRRMVGVDPITNEESAHIISNSYAGILRLSPNANATLKNLDSTVITEDEIPEYINFDDVITKYFKKQYITASSSDGALLDLAISNKGVEFNTLYVRGALSIKPRITDIMSVKAALSISTGSEEEESFKIDGLNMPNHYNSAASIYYVDPTEEPEKYITSDNLDKSFILMSTSDDFSNFQFQNSSTIIETFIRDNLLKLNSLPTGSIHFLPMTFAKWQSLSPDSTLKRDFLLCDGSEYFNTSYPELAKILYKEKIYTNNKYYINNYSGSDKKFRVPDLRNRFIQSVVPDPNASPAEVSSDGTQFVGQYIESSFPIKDNRTHYHYIVLDTPIANNSNNISVKDNKINFIANKTPLAKYASFGSGARIETTSGCPGCDRRACRGTPSMSASYILYPSASPKGCAVGSPSCGYILANPPKKSAATIGRSIGTKYTYENISETNINDANLNYTNNNKIIYSKADNYVKYKETQDGKNIGYETTPEYFSVLPLIKI